MRAAGSKRMLEAALMDIAGAIKSATPGKDAAAHLKGQLVLNQWVARHKAKEG